MTEIRDSQVQTLHALVERDGIRLVPLLPGEKRPFFDDWNNPARVDEMTRLALERLPSGGNVGVLLGKSAGGLLDVDIDYDLSDFREFVLQATPFATMVWGRSERIPTHYLFRLDNPSDGRPVRLGKIELRYGRETLLQSMLPPSVHPSGRPLVWIRTEGIPTVSFVTVLEHFGKLALVAELLPHWKPSQRHLLSLHFAGYAARRGLDEAGIRWVLESVAQLAGDRERGDRGQAAEDTFVKLQMGEKVTGGPSLERLIGEEAFATIRKIFDAMFGVGAVSEQPDMEPYITIAMRAYGTAELVGNLMYEFNQQTHAPLRWCVEENAWYQWNTRYWERVSEEEVFTQARSFAIGVLDAAIKKRIAQLQAEYDKRCEEGEEPGALDVGKDPLYKRLVAMRNDVGYRNGGVRDGIARFRGEPGVFTHVREFDCHPHLVNCANGVLDIDTGQLLPHDPALLLTQCLPWRYSPDTDCPRFKRFLREVMSEEEAMVQYLLETLSLALYGRNPHAHWFVWHGSRGGNGKSTLLSVMYHVLGCYFGAASRAALDSERRERLSLALASFVGLRGAACEELPRHQRLDSSVLKLIVAGGREKIRLNYEKAERDAWLECTLYVTTNVAIALDELDWGVQRRLKIIPFRRSFHEAETCDPQLAQKLYGESEAIFSLLAQTAIRLAQNNWKIEEPETVRAATREYILSRRTFDVFLRECTEADEQSIVSAREMEQRFREWLYDEDLLSDFTANFLDGDDSRLSAWIGTRMKETQHGKKRRADGVYYTGLRFKTQPPRDPAPTPRVGKQPEGVKGECRVSVGGDAHFELKSEGLKGFPEKSPHEENPRNTFSENRGFELKPLHYPYTNPSSDNTPSAGGEPEPTAAPDLSYSIPWGVVERSLLLRIAELQSDAVKAKLAQSLGMPAYEKDAFYRAIAEPERFEQAFWLLAQLGTNLWLHDRAIAPTRPPLESVFWQGAALMLAEKLGYPEIRKERVQIAQGYKPWTDTLPYTERLLAREYVKALLRRLMENDPSERRLVEITRQQSESGIVESAEKSAQSVQSVQMNSESDGQMDSYPPTTAQSVHHPPTENEFKSGDLGGLGGLDGCFSDSTKTLSPPDAPLDEAERLRQVIRDWMTTHEPFPITINGRRIPASFWGYAVKHASLAQLQEWVAQLPAQSRR